jgi:hypothetical protein
MGCSCAQCRRLQSDAGRIHRRAKAQEQLPVEVRQQLLDAIYAPVVPQRASQSEPDSGPGLGRVDREWSEALETALAATRRDALKHGTNAAYVHGCVCSECREHRRQWMAKNRG